MSKATDKEIADALRYCMDNGIYFDTRHGLIKGSTHFSTPEEFVREVKEYRKATGKP